MSRSISVLQLQGSFVPLLFVLFLQQAFLFQDFLPPIPLKVSLRLLSDTMTNENMEKVTDAEKEGTEVKLGMG